MEKQTPKKYIMRANMSDPYDCEQYYLVFSNLEQLAKDCAFLAAQERILHLAFESVNAYYLGDEPSSSILLEKLAKISKCGEKADEFIEITEYEIEMNLELMTSWTPAEIGCDGTEVRITVFTDDGYRVYRDLDVNYVTGTEKPEFPIKEYRENQNRCPYCKSISICGGDLDMDFIESGQIKQKIECSRCGHEWEDVYNIVQVNCGEETFNLKIM